MIQRDILHGFTQNILYYLTEKDDVKRLGFEKKLSTALFETFRASYPDKGELKINFEIRKKINASIPDVVVIPLYRFEKDNNKVEYKFTKWVSAFFVSFSEDAATKYDAETITALTMYGFAQVLTSTLKVRMTKAALSLSKKFNLDIASIEMNQLIGAANYLFSFSAPYYLPVKDFTTNPVLDLLFFMSPSVYRAYCKYAVKKHNIADRLIADERHDDLSPTGSSPLLYLKGAEELNCKMNDDMVRNDNRNVYSMAYMANDGKLDEYLEEIHDLTGFVCKLKSILMYREGAPYLRDQKDVTEFLDIMTESFFGPKNESEFRYKLNKIIIASRYLDNEDDRTTVLVQIYSLKQKLKAFIEKEESKIEKAKTKKEAMDIGAMVEYCNLMLEELNDLENKVVNSEIKPKKFGIFIEYPAGYNY